MSITFFTISGTPDSGGPINVTKSGKTSLAKGSLKNSTDAAGKFPTLNIEGLLFNFARHPKTSPADHGIRIYSGVASGGKKAPRQIQFAYLQPASGENRQAKDKITLIEGQTEVGETISEISLLSGQPLGNHNDVVCFTPGSLVATPRGNRPIETLKTGDLVHTIDNGLQAIRWVGHKKISGARLQVSPELFPVRIRKNAFGPQCPNQDMWVSPQHRFLFKNPKSALMFGYKEVLAPAKALTHNKNVTIDQSIRNTQYIHLMFDQHEIIFVDGLKTESFQPSNSTLRELDEEPRKELFAKFPELENHANAAQKTARFSLHELEARLLKA